MNYIKPEANIKEFEVENVIMLSGGGAGNFGNGDIHIGKPVQ